MINEDILKRVNEKKERKEYISQCVDVMICPDCGGDLTTKDWGHGYSIICPAYECSVPSKLPPWKVSKVWDDIL